MHLRNQILQLLEADDGAPAGGGQQQQQRPKKTPQEAFESLVEREHGGNYESAAWALYNETFKIRRRAQSAEGERDELAGRVAPDNAVILTGNDVQLWQQFRALDKDPTDIKKELDRVGTLETEASERRKDDAVRAAAKAAGFKYSVLNRLGRGLDYVTREETVEDDNGNKTKVERAYVKEGDKETLIDEYATREWEDMMPSLRVQEADAADNGAGVQYFRQAGADSSESDRQPKKGALAAHATAGYGPKRPAKQAE
jgi:hypothetical protein